MIEVTKRLPPTPSTLRMLYVRSGNQCAFPDCVRVLVNHKGQWVGEVCHIEAAMPGGPRFDDLSTNEGRRHPDNLLLMCHEHHVETDAVLEFPVDRMRSIKATHETRFTGEAVPYEEQIEIVVNDIVQSTVTDLTERIELRLPQTLDGYNAVLEIGLERQQLDEYIKALQPALQSIRVLPVDARALFAVMVDRSLPGEAMVPVHELEQVTGLSQHDCYLHATTLERYGVAIQREEDLWPEERPPLNVLVAREIDWWDFWPEFNAFCQGTQRSARELINELRFDVLDDVPPS